MEENTTAILRAKALLNFPLSLIPSGGKRCTFHLSSFKSTQFDQGVQSKNPFVHNSYVGQVTSI